jgi:hypothetical protein
MLLNASRVSTTARNPLARGWMRCVILTAFLAVRSPQDPVMGTGFLGAVEPTGLEDPTHRQECLCWERRCLRWINQGEPRSRRGRLAPGAGVELAGQRSPPASC